MVAFKAVALTTVAVLALARAASAADLLPPPPVIEPPPPPIEVGGWYLRGDVGVGATGAFDLDFLQNPLNSSNFAIQHASMGDTTFFNAGVGYEFNNWLRVDVTGEYRTKAAVNAFGIYTFGGATNVDTYQGFLKSTVFLANGYIDLGTWNCLTPFVGAGVGVAYNTLSDFVDVGMPTAGSGIGRNSSKFDLAWALHAGVSYAVTQNFSVELAYRYLNYGSVTDTIDCTGGCNPDSYKLKSLSSNDLMLGVRWRFPVEYVQPQYQPPQYPLSTRG
jgi:opacity protein-like surface antigen